MQRLGIVSRALMIGVGVSSLSGCVTSRSAIDALPVVDAVDKPNDMLREIPPPEHKITVAVYDFEDLTGQFKERDNVQSLSRAVTQGGASILIKALQDAGERRWFTVLERKELENLLRERQIVTEMNRIYRNEVTINPKVLPPLMHAGIIIEGGIIGYDTNILTGGVGARFLGIGGDTKYVQDVVTVTLRAVSTKTGEVLTSVTTRKAVASYELQGGAFRFVKLDELLEAEGGTTYNEPKQIAVEAAIDKAVAALIIEGAELKIWNFKNKAAGDAYIAAYRKKKYDDFYTLAAANPVKPESAGRTEIAATVPKAPPRVTMTQHRIPTRTSSGLPQSRVNPDPGSVRQIPGVGFVPTQDAPEIRQPVEENPPQLPPSKQPNEPAVGMNEQKSNTRVSML